MKDFLIIYEVKRRELETAFLLKLFLEQSGYTCEVSNFYESSFYSLTGRQRYKVIIVPQLYDTEYIARAFSRFGVANAVFNMQCEQVLSDDFEEVDLHSPKGEAKKAIHACWGQRTKEKLIKGLIDVEKLPVVGSITTDFLRSEVISNSLSREELAKEFRLDMSKKWLLFTSSFTFADMPLDRRKMDERLLGIDLSSRIELFSQSRALILIWFEEYLKKIDNIIIYRPHPDEYNLEQVLALAEKYPNFRIISNYSVRVWTYVCDSILNWYSTSCVEAYFLNKPYYVLRPVPIPEDMELTLMKKVEKLNSLEKFLEKNIFTLNRLSHDQECMENFYYFDPQEPSVKKYLRELIKLRDSDEKIFFNFSLRLMVISKFKTFLVYFLHKSYILFLRSFYKPNNNGKSFYLSTWFRAFYFNIASDKEKKETLKGALVMKRLLDSRRGL